MRIRAWIGLILVALLLSGSSLAAPKTHVVEKGHSLWSIARRYGVTVTALRAKNHLKKGDALQIGQRLEIPPKDWKPDGSEPSKDDDTKDEKPSRSSKSPDWVNAKPAPETQTQKTAKERGVNPCNTPDPGWGTYTRWDRAPSIGQMIMPERGGVSRSGAFDVMIHFHGHEPVRKEWVKVMNGTVLVGIDLGIGSGPYEATFRSPAAFKALLASIEKGVAEHSGNKKAHIRKLGLSAWSAGYGAVESILRIPEYAKSVDSVVLLDGLHSANTEPMKSKQLDPFVDFAKQAARRRKFMFVSHSSIIPPGYASTTETMHFLVNELGGKPRKGRPRKSDPMGLDLIDRYDRGFFHERGYSGNDKMDHCAHIGLYKDVLKVHIKRRWNSPRGYAAKATRAKK
ncbi:MAG: LysM peptidoglycan-binding domain-containing protein [Polyangiaceae bacterium]|nr:LysM peptidoglycan-binding domain-containing protein [Myxococcales bacterium]MCB9589182.1 LysM peptidoglycan-binding domain-containing protein [Polyangiaceae bacterium]